jgi:hypothetical protein
MMMDDCVPLGPDDEIREGDIFDTPNRTFVMPVVGSKVRDYPGLRMKRPRSTVIRDAAIAVLEWYFRDGSVGGAEDPMYALMAAVGVTEEWLRRA